MTLHEKNTQKIKISLSMRMVIPAPSPGLSTGRRVRRGTLLHGTDYIPWTLPGGHGWGHERVSVA